MVLVVEVVPRIQSTDARCFISYEMEQKSLVKINSIFHIMHTNNIVAHALAVQNVSMCRAVIQCQIQMVNLFIKYPQT